MLALEYAAVSRFQSFARMPKDFLKGAVSIMVRKRFQLTVELVMLQ